MITDPTLAPAEPVIMPDVPDYPIWRVVSSPRAELVGKRVASHTKHQARALLKKHLGVKELPPHTELERE